MIFNLTSSFNSLPILAVAAMVSLLLLNVTVPKMPLLSLPYWGCCIPKDHLLQFWLQSSRFSPSPPEKKMAGLGTGAKLICIGNLWPRVGSGGLRGHLSRGLVSQVLQLPLLSRPSLVGQRHLPGSCWLFKMLMGSWGAVSAASRLTSPVHKRCCIFIHLETLNYIDSSSCLSYNDPRFLSRNVCTL